VDANRYRLRPCPRPWFVDVGVVVVTVRAGCGFAGFFFFAVTGMSGFGFG
jgi:hypothetical protein